MFRSADDDFFVSEPTATDWPPILAGCCATLLGIGLQRFAYGPILPAMVQAATMATGCSVIEGTAVGDSGVMNARLRCA